MRDLFDEPISIVEELDPEPTGRWVHLREVMLGFLLLAGVLAWSGWEWWQQDQNQSNYLIAQQAADNQEWDRALQYFGMVKGFKDADVRASDMNKLVTERDTQYEIASSSAEKGDWATTLQATEAVRRVQRNYRDTGQLEAQASWEVYLGALQGVVALRTQGRKPALYYRGMSSWEWLPRSDRSSQVLPTLDASGAILYDVPGENWDQVKLTPTATPAPASFRISGMTGLKGRALQVSRYGNNNGSHYFGVNFDPSEHNYYWVGDKGMWAFRLGDRIGKRPRVMLGFGAIEVAYQAFGSSKTVKVNVQPNWTAMDFAPDGEHLLLVEEGSDSDPQGPLNVYLADGTGGNRKLLYSHDGSIQGIQFSPDSKYALITAHTYKAGGTTVYRVVLIDLQKSTPHTLIERTLKYDQQRTNYPLPVAGGFLREGRFKGYALVTDDTGDPARIYMFAPGRPPPALLNIPVESVPIGLVWAAQRGDNTVLIWHEEADTSSGAGPLVALEMGSDWSVTQSTLPVEGKGFMAFGGIRDRWFLFGSAELGRREVLYSIFSMPLAELHERRQMPEPLYSAGLPDASEFAFARAIYPGRTMLSYVDKGELHVRTYDSKVDLALENGVQHLYDPLFNASWLQLR
ncbi:MAG: hypothetical protein ABIO92_02025 [Chloroflexia bacterium]